MCAQSLPSNFTGAKRKQKSILINFTENGRDFHRELHVASNTRSQTFTEVRKSRLKSLHGDMKYVMRFVEISQVPKSH